MNDLTGNSSSSPSGAAPDRRLIMAGIALVLVACACVCVLGLAAGTWAIYSASRATTQTAVALAARPTATPRPTATRTPFPGTRAPTTISPTTTSANIIKVVSDLPMTGSSLGQTQTIVNAIKQAFEEKSSTVCDGQYTLVYEANDDASAALGKWDPDVVVANAKKYAADQRIVAVIGTYNSGAAKFMIPILNPESLVLISPGNTYPGLTHAASGATAAGEPDKYYPNGHRNYARVTIPDDVQGAVGAEWARELGVKLVYVLDDGDPYGQLTAGAFEATAQQIGLEVLDHKSIDPQAANYKALANRIKNLKPDLIYYGGIAENNAGQLVKDLRGAGYTGLIMGPDGVQVQSFIEAAGAEAAEGVYATLGSVFPEHLPDSAALWRKAYEQKYSSAPEAYAVYGYVAATLLLDAFERVCSNGGSPTDRTAVRDAVFATTDFDSILGPIGINAQGDPTLNLMSGYQVRNGQFEFVTLLGGP